MKPEEILEIARRYTVPKEESSLLVEFNSDDVPTPTGETLNLMMWNFCEEELLAFAQSVIEADRGSSDEPVAWMNREGYLTHYRQGDAIIPLYTRPAPARKPLSDDEILRVATKSPPFIPWLLQEGVTLGDVRGMAVDFARRIEKAHGIGETE